MNPLVMTWASGETFCKSEGFSIYIKSLKNIPNARKVILTHDMPEEIRVKINNEVEIHDYDKEKIHYILRDRHLAFWDFLRSNYYYHDACLITDCKDVVFQADPFKFGIQGGYENKVVLVNEGMHHVNSGWNLIDQLEAQSNVREFKKDLRQWKILNGGVMLGNCKKMMELLFLLWTNTVRATGKCTDQGVLNYLYTYLQQMTGYVDVGPHVYDLCLTGEAVKEGFIEVECRDGIFYCPLDNAPYRIVHQWERTKFKNDVLDRYSK